MILQLNTIWAIEQTAFNEIKMLIDATLPSILQGHADNAERSGLPIKVQGNTAIITVRGPIVKGEGVLTRYYGFVSSRAIQQAINAAVADDAIKQILLIFDTPGGSVDGLSDAGDAIFAARHEKTVIGQVDGSVMSAGYYMASQVTKLYAGRNDLIGSIGTRMMLYDFSEAFKENGIKAIPIDTGEHKSAGAFGTKITEAQINEFQRIVDRYFADFLQMVSNGRDMPIEDVKKVADGRVFFPEESAELGLIDGIKSVEQTVSELLAAEAQRSTQAAHNRLKLMNTH